MNRGVYGARSTYAREATPADAARTQPHEESVVQHFDYHFNYYQNWFQMCITERFK